MWQPQMFCSVPSVTALYCSPPRLCTSRVYVNHPLQGVWAWLLQNAWQLLQITHPIPFKKRHNPETLLIPLRRQPRKISGAYFAYCWVGHSVFRNSLTWFLEKNAPPFPPPCIRPSKNIIALLIPVQSLVLRCKDSGFLYFHDDFIFWCIFYCCCSNDLIVFQIQLQNLNPRPVITMDVPSSTMDYVFYE